MTFPANDLETVLLAASRNETTAATFVELLFRSTAWFPMTVDESGDGSLSVITIDQTAFVPLFTSQDEATTVMEGAPLVEASVREFMEGVPTHLGLAVNPSGTLGLPISADTVQHQLNRATTISLGTTVRLGDPAVERTELLEAIAVGLGTVPAVHEARRVWAQVGDDAPGLVIGVDVDPDNPEMREATIAAVGSARRGVPGDFAVDVVFTNDRNDFTEWMNTNAAPFFSV